jgi:hypothetical protein
VKAYATVTARHAAIERRRDAEREETLRVFTEYSEQATLELTRRKRERTSGRRLFLMPDDIDIDPKDRCHHRSQRQVPSFFDGPVTPDQKVAQDLLVSAWRAVDREWRNSPLFVAKDRRFLRLHAKLEKQVLFVW